MIIFLLWNKTAETRDKSFADPVSDILVKFLKIKLRIAMETLYYEIIDFKNTNRR